MHWLSTEQWAAQSSFVRSFVVRRPHLSPLYYVLTIQTWPVTYSIFSKIRGLDDIYDVPVCHSCHMMIIQQANLLGLTHILKSYSEQGFKAEFCTVVHCLVIATSTLINLQSSFQKILFLCLISGNWSQERTLNQWYSSIPRLQLWRKTLNCFENRIFTFSYSKENWVFRKLLIVLIWPTFVVWGVF